jgi:uncharacterized protein (DUF2236 family)
MWPSLASVLPGSGWLNRLLTATCCPLTIRDQYGLESTAADARRARRVFTIVRGLRSVMPNRIAQWPHVRRLPPDEPEARLHAPKRI